MSSLEQLREVVRNLADTFNNPNVRESSYFDFYDDSLNIHGFPPNLPSNKKGSTGQEIYPFEEGINGKFVKLTITSTSSKDGWASIQEIGALGLPSGYNQTGGGGIPPGGIPPGDNQTGGPVDNQTR